MAVAQPVLKVFMILINSDNLDFSTAEVIKWLVHAGKKVTRINGPDILFRGDMISKIEQLTINDFVIEINGKKIKYSEIEQYWYRRGMFNMEIKLKKDKSAIRAKTADYLVSEKKAILGFIEILLASKASICDFFRADVNKLVVLREAHRVGLKIPGTIITQDAEVMKKFRRKNAGAVITKVIDKNIVLNTGQYWMPMYTAAITDTHVKKLGKSFFPGIFQQQVKKKYELRIFYLCGEMYSMAIFSQTNRKTRTDFRRYDMKKPNRQVPFNLPPEIAGKLTRLMQRLNLNTGSIDMMVDEQDDYYFLEVNPVGQFGMTSYPCNYQLEKKIAAILSAN